MKTRWTNWQATIGQLSAEYEAEREWAENVGVRLKFNLYIQFEGLDRFYVSVYDWYGTDVIDPKYFGRFDEAFDYLYDVDCENYVDNKWETISKDDLTKR